MLRFIMLKSFLVGLFFCVWSVSAEEADTPQKPNILWLVVEDMSPILEMYGDTTVKTPNISSLASDGVVFTNAYSTSGVCAPSRATLAMGMYPTSFGANNMRTGSHTQETGLPKYEAIPPANAKMLSHYMQLGGYYTTNNYKTDYQFVPPKGVWNDNSKSAHWRHRPDGMPFFSVMNFTTTHESGLFEPYGIREIEFRHYLGGDKDAIAALPQHHSVKTSPKDTPVHLNRDTAFNIPPYLPDTETVRRDFWKMYNNLIETDRQIGAVLQQLKDDGLYDDTIIFFYADHGGPLPRQKRLVYDSGIKVPLIIRFPHGQFGGTRDERLVSFVDFAPSTLALANLPIPETMQGVPFLSDKSLADGKQRQYIFAGSDRLDAFTDTKRAVRDKRFKYIRNYRPEQTYYLPIAYREKIPTMQELLALQSKNQLTPAQQQWFREQKDSEELFDTQNDPHELHNLASDVAFAEDLTRLRRALTQWQVQTNENPEQSESTLISQLWEGSEQQPATQSPIVSIKEDIIVITNQTEGAVIAVNIDNAGWQLYQSPIRRNDMHNIQVVAHRLGFKPSEVGDYNLKN